MDICLLWINLLWTFWYMSFGGHEHSFLLNLCLEVDCWALRDAYYSFSRHCQFSKAIVPFGVPVRSVWELLLLCPLPALGIVSVFSFSHCGGCVVVSHCDFHFPLENVHMPPDCCHNFWLKLLPQFQNFWLVSGVWGGRGNCRPWADGRSTLNRRGGLGIAPALKSQRRYHLCASFPEGCPVRELAHYWQAYSFFQETCFSYDRHSVSLPWADGLLWGFFWNYMSWRGTSSHLFSKWQCVSLTTTPLIPLSIGRESGKRAQETVESWSRWGKPNLTFIFLSVCWWASEHRLL